MHVHTETAVLRWCQVLRTSGLWVPLVNLQGVYILPGIPRLFQQMLEAHKDRFRGPAASSLQLLTNMGEGDLAGKTLSLPPTFFPQYTQTAVCP